MKHYTRPKNIDTSYGFVVARIRVKDQYILQSSDIKQILNFTEQIDINLLLDRLRYPMAGSISQRIAIGSQRQDLFLKKYCPEPIFWYTLLIEQLYSQIKSDLKVYLLEEKSLEEPIENGIYPLFGVKAQEITELMGLASGSGLTKETFTKLEDYGINKSVDDPPVQGFPLYMRQVITEVITDYINTNSGARIDRTLDQACFKHQQYLAQASGIDFLKEYVQLKIDSANLSTLFRFYKKQPQHTQIRPLFVPDGRLSLELFLDLLGKSKEDLQPYFNEKHWETMLNYFKIDSSEIKNPFSVSKDNLFLALAKKQKDVLVGPSVLGAYWIMKQMEVKNIRMLSTQEQQQLSIKHLLSVLRGVDVYE